MSAVVQRGGHVLLGEAAGWRSAALDGVVATRELTLATKPGSAVPLADADGTFGGFTAPTGVAVDVDDQVYVLDAGAAIVKRFDPCTQTFEILPCLGGVGVDPRQLSGPRGIDVSRRGDLYVADTGNRRVQVFSLKGLALRAIWGPYRFDAAAAKLTPAAPGDDGPGVWEPWDVAAGPHGRVFVSDRENGVVHVFASDGPCGVLPAATAGVQLVRPTHLAVDCDGRVYVIEENADDVVVIAPDGSSAERVQAPEQLAGRFCATGIAVDDDGSLCVGALAFDLAGNAIVVDGKQRVCMLDRAATFESEGYLITGPLDSRIFRCEWHRVLLDATVPDGTAVSVSTFTSEAERPIEHVLALPEERWSQPFTDGASEDPSWDCLVLSPPGRYLWLRLKLAGGSDTPVLRKAKVFYPRASTLRFLPAVYGEDPQARDFTARFLSIFDTVRDSVSQRVDGIAAYFDPRSAPAGGPAGDALQWLASWLGLALDPRLPEERRRLLVRRAYELFRRRGTPEGLRLYLSLYTGVQPLVLEHFKLRRWLMVGDATLGDRSALFGDAIVRRLQLDRYSRVGDFQLLDTGDPLHDPFDFFAHQFTVFVPARGACDAGARAAIRQVVELAKPAHAKAAIEFVEPRFRIGTQSLVGLDTVVGRYPDAVVEGEARLGYDSVLGPSPDEAEPPTIRVGIRSRIGSNTVID
jgi:phage tail-like protein